MEVIMEDDVKRTKALCAAAKYDICDILSKKNNKKCKKYKKDEKIK